MNVFVVLVLVAGFLILANVAVAATNRAKDLRAKADYWAKKRALEARALWSIVLTENRGLNVRAYNPEGFEPPLGMTKYSGSIPAGVSVVGYQGSFGLAQVYHSDAYSTARAYRPSGLYPEELLDADINLQVASAFIADLIRKGYKFPDQADVYNVGETKYRSGVRNGLYLATVKANYERS